MIKIFPTVLITIGVAGIIFALRALFVWELPFIGRNDILYIISINENQYLFWFIELFYLFGGIVFFLLGLKEYKDEF